MPVTSSGFREYKDMEPAVRAEQMPATENVERQVPIAVVHRQTSARWRSHRDRDCDAGLAVALLSPSPAGGLHSALARRTLLCWPRGAELRPTAHRRIRLRSDASPQDDATAQLPSAAGGAPERHFQYSIAQAISSRSLSLTEVSFQILFPAICLPIKIVE